MSGVLPLLIDDKVMPSKYFTRCGLGMSVRVHASCVVITAPGLTPGDQSPDLRARNVNSPKCVIRIGAPPWDRRARLAATAGKLGRSHGANHSDQKPCKHR